MNPSNDGKEFEQNPKDGSPSESRDQFKTPGMEALEDAGYRMVYGLLTLRNEEKN